MQLKNFHEVFDLVALDQNILLVSNMQHQTLHSFLHVSGDPFELTNPDFTSHHLILPKIVNGLISYDENSLLPLLVFVPGVVEFVYFESGYFNFTLIKLFCNNWIIRKFQKFKFIKCLLFFHNYVITLNIKKKIYYNNFDSLILI